MNQDKLGFALLGRQGQVFISFDRQDEERPVRIVWARPISKRGGHVSILDVETKKELVLIEDIDDLDAESRTVADAALDERYMLPIITRVRQTDPHFGNRYWNVETDRGAREFVVKDVNRNVIWVSDDHLVIRDTLGNRYEIPSLSALDRRSQMNVDKVT